MGEEELVRIFQEEAETVTRESWWQDMSMQDRENFLVYGLADECGEVLTLFKDRIVDQAFGTGEGLDEEHLIEELGDVLWHIAMISAIYEIKLEEVMAKSIKKFRKKFPERFKGSLLEILEGYDAPNTDRSR